MTWECFEERKKKSDRAFSFVVVSIAHVTSREGNGNAKKDWKGIMEAGRKGYQSKAH